MFELFGHAWNVYTKNLRMVLFFSIPFIIALVLLVPEAILPKETLEAWDIKTAPNFAALGGYFLRSGSMPSLTIAEIILIVVASLVSLYLLSLALVAINLIVKSQRTRTKVSGDAIRNLGKYTFLVFCLFLAYKIIETGILFYTIENNVSELPVYIFAFIASLALFYVAPAVVLEEKKPAPAIAASFKHIAKKPIHFILWLITAFIALSVVMFVVYGLLEPAGIPRIALQAIVILVNSLVILPFLIILQAQIYIAKYTIIK